MDYKDTIMSNDRPHFTTMEELKHLWELGLMVNQYPISRMSWVTRKDGGDIMIIIPGCKADLICPIAPNSKYFDIEGNLRPEYTMIPAYSVEDLMCLLPNNFKVSKYTQEGETLYKLEIKI